MGWITWIQLLFGDLICYVMLAGGSMRLPPRSISAGSKALQMLYSLPAFCRARADDSSEPSWTSQSQQPYVRVHLKVSTLVR